MERSYFEMFDEKIRPFLQPAMFGYLAYFFTEVSMTTVDAAAGELTAQTLNAMNQYAMIVSLIAAAATAATFVATWFDDPCNKEKKDMFSRRLQNSLNPLVMASIFQLLAIYVVGHDRGLKRYTNAEDDEHGAESVAAGVIIILTCLTSYMTVDPEQGKQTIRGDKDTWLTQILDSILGNQRTHNMLACMVSGILVLTAWSYNVARGAFVGPWYEAFTVMLLCVLANFGVGVKGESVPAGVRKGMNLVFHVFIIYFLAKYLDTEADNFVALALVIASAVLNVSSNPTPTGRVNAKLNAMVGLVLRCTHAAVAIVAWVAVNEMTGDDKILYALVHVGALLKLVSCFLPVSQLEFLSRNGSTLILLIPFAALQTDSAENLQIAAFALIIAARGIDAIQNTVLGRTSSFSLGKLGSELIDDLGALPPKGSFDNPIVYVILTGLITTSIGLVLGGNEACHDGILDPSANCTGYINATHSSTEVLTERESTVLRVAIALVWTHALSGLAGALIAMAEDKKNATDPSEGVFVVLGYLAPSTLELFRTSVATTVIGLLAYVAHQSGDTVGSDSILSGWLYISLFVYIFVDVLGRNVV